MITLTAILPCIIDYKTVKNRLLICREIFSGILEDISLFLFKHGIELLVTAFCVP